MYRIKLLNLRIIREAQTGNLWCRVGRQPYMCALQSVYRLEGMESDRV